jgi:transcriptional regulator of heat shock response
MYPTKMTERTAQILEAAIQEFIATGAPVSSGLLYDRYEFGIKPAMIRIELDALEDAGYLQKPHYSAGRIPTNVGYEFFADRVLDAKNPDRKAGAAANASASDLKRLIEEQALPDLLRELSGQLGLLSVVANLAAEEIYKSGLDHLIDHLDWEDQAGIRSVIHDFENVDARLPRAAEEMGEGTNVFIGKKSPVTRSESLSVVCGNYKVDGDVISIFAIGPKRMDYRKVIKVFKNL